MQQKLSDLFAGVPESIKRTGYIGAIYVGAQLNADLLKLMLPLITDDSLAAASVFITAEEDLAVPELSAPTLIKILKLPSQFSALLRPDPRTSPPELDSLLQSAHECIAEAKVISRGNVDNRDVLLVVRHAIELYDQQVIALLFAARSNGLVPVVVTFGEEGAAPVLSAVNLP